MSSLNGHETQWALVTGTGGVLRFPLATHLGKGAKKASDPSHPLAFSASGFMLSEIGCRNMSLQQALVPNWLLALNVTAKGGVCLSFGPPTLAEGGRGSRSPPPPGQSNHPIHPRATRGFSCFLLPIPSSPFMKTPGRKHIPGCRPSIRTPAPPPGPDAQPALRPTAGDRGDSEDKSENRRLVRLVRPPRDEKRPLPKRPCAHSTHGSPLV